MLGKLIKYDFKSLRRILLPLYGAVIAMGIISPLSVKLTESLDYSGFNVIRLIAYLTVVLYICLIISAFVLSLIVTVTRFKNSLLGSEGYLMNVLPVKQWQSIFSKLLSASVYEVLSVIAAIISIICAGAVIEGFAAINPIYFFRGIGQLVSFYGAGYTILYTVEFILICASILACFNLTFYAALSVGHSAANKKVLKSVGAYVAFYLISQIINIILLNIAISVGFFNTPVVGPYFPQIYIIAFIVLEALYTVAYYAITNYFLKNKLNLQ